MTRDDTGMYLTQTRYIEELLKRTNIDNSTTCPPPAVIGKHLNARDGDLMESPTTYRSVIGAFQYVTHIRPDLLFIINRLSQFQQSSTIKHWQVAKRVLRYLKGTKDLGLHIKPCDFLAIYGFSYAD